MNFIRLISSVYKEFLVLIRDRAGLAILFLMPTVLIFIMTIIQDSTFKTVKESKISLIFLNQDKDSLGMALEEGLQSSDFFDLYYQTDTTQLTEDKLKHAVARGAYKIGIVIPAYATDAIRNNVSRLLDNSASFNPMAKKKRKQTASIKIYIDPVTSDSFKNAVLSALKEFTSKLEMKIFFEHFSQQLAGILPEKQNMDMESIATIEFEEVYASTSGATILPNSVQHNVPAWTMFAMFFIVLPLAGNMIKERDDGSAFRLKTMPGSYLIVMMSKILIYLAVALLQFLLMLMVGKFIMPLMGLPELTIGPNKLNLLLMALISGFAATSYGVLIGTIASTHEQAATFGSVSIIILAAIGGIWVPVYVMPHFMQIISNFSPMHWGLEGFYDIFLRGSSIRELLPEMLKLILFGIAAISFAGLFNKSKNKI